MTTDNATHYAIPEALPTSSAFNDAVFLVYEVIVRHRGRRQQFTYRGREFLSCVVNYILHSGITTTKLMTFCHLQTNEFLDSMYLLTAMAISKFYYLSSNSRITYPVKIRPEVLIYSFYSGHSHHNLGHLRRAHHSSFWIDRRCH